MLKIVAVTNFGTLPIIRIRARRSHQRGSCPGTVIYKELKKGDKDFSPYQYKYQNPIKLDSADWDRIKDFIIKIT
jgi:hypothetical protein